MRETEKIWMNGELVDWADAKVHVGAHGLHYGSGVFEGIRAYETDRGTAGFRLPDHARRAPTTRPLRPPAPPTPPGAPRSAAARTPSTGCTTRRSSSTWSSRTRLTS